MTLKYHMILLSYPLCISTREHMLVHAFAWSKTMKNIQKSWKSTFSIMRTRGSCKAHEEKRRKKFVGQRLGVTPKSWLTPKRWLLIWNFVVLFSTWASHMPDAKMLFKKYIKHTLMLKNVRCLTKMRYVLDKGAGTQTLVEMCNM